MMRLTILTINETLFDDEVEGITAPGTLGEFTALSHHVPFLTSLVKGVIVIHRKSKEKTYIEVPSNGIFELYNEQAVALL